MRKILDDFENLKLDIYHNYMHIIMNAQMSMLGSNMTSSIYLFE